MMADLKMRPAEALSHEIARQTRDAIFNSTVASAAIAFLGLLWAIISTVVNWRRED